MGVLETVFSGVAVLVIGGLINFFGGAILTFIKSFFKKRTPKAYTADEIREIKKLTDEIEGKGQIPSISFSDVEKLQKALIALQDQTYTDTIKLKEASILIGRDAAKVALEGKIEEAKSKFKQAIDTYPELEVINLYGTFLMRIGELDGAIRQFEKAVEVGEQENNQSTVAAGYGNLGIVYQIKGELEKAIDYYEKRWR